MNSLLKLAAEWAPAIGGAVLTVVVAALAAYWVAHERPAETLTMPKVPPPPVNPPSEPSL